MSDSFYEFYEFPFNSSFIFITFFRSPLSRLSLQTHYRRVFYTRYTHTQALTKLRTRRPLIPAQQLNDKLDRSNEITVFRLLRSTPRVAFRYSSGI